MVCACIYHSCKKHYYRSLKEIAQQIEGLIDKSKQTVRHVITCYSLINKELKLKYQPKNLISLVPRYVSEAELPKKMIPLTINFLEHCNAEIIFNGKDPNGVVAAAVYLIGKKAGYSITQTRISHIANITDVTVRSRMNKLQKLI